MKHKSAVPWLVAAVCLGPFALALVFFYGRWDVPLLAGSRELLEPPVATPQDWLAPPDGGAYRWSLIYAKMSSCEQQCARDLERLRQVHLALGRDVEHLQRVYLHTGEARPPRDNNRPEDPALLERRLDEAQGATVARALDPKELAEGRLYIADPRGNLVASYPPDVDQKELLRDLKRLLAGSN